MNVKDRILNLTKELTSETADINNLLIVVVTRFQLFEPCVYLSEDDEWLDVAMISLETNNISQALSIKKEEITTLGIFNKPEVAEAEEAAPKEGSEEDLYQ